MTAERLRKELTSDSDVRENVMLRDYTTFRVGGPADIFADIGCEADMIKIIDIINNENIPFFILGNGSNLLISDSGFRGIAVKIGSGAKIPESEAAHSFPDFIDVRQNRIEAGAGALLSAVSRAAAAGSLTGLEFAGGIPGSLGGAVFMNAGAYGGEMSQILTEVRAVMSDGSIRTFNNSELKMGYRHSIFSENGAVILSAVMELNTGDRDGIESYMKELSKRRAEKQPLNMPSAGSTFKRPEGHFAGKLIEDAGLKGLSIGGAKVSEKHSGFIVNSGGASAEDIMDLIRIVQLRVKDEFGIELETEVRMVGEF